MTQTQHVIDTEFYKRLVNIHTKLTFDKAYRSAFQQFLSELEKDNKQIPNTYEELEAVYHSFSEGYTKTHH